MMIKRDNDKLFQLISLSNYFLSPPNVGKSYSSKMTVDCVKMSSIQHIFSIVSTDSS